jgi:hypothetical protein
MAVKSPLVGAGLNRITGFLFMHTVYAPRSIDLDRVASGWTAHHRGMDNQTDTTTEARVDQAVMLGPADGARALCKIGLPLGLSLRVLLHPARRRPTSAKPAPS